MPAQLLQNVPIRRIKHSMDESPLWSIVGSLVISLLGFTISFPISVLFLIVCPIVFSIRGCLFYIYYYRRSRIDLFPLKSLTAQETVYADSRYDVLNSILEFDGDDVLTLEHFQEILANKILPYYPKLKSLLVVLPYNSGLRYCWQQDVKFSIARHVFLGPKHIQNNEEISNYVRELIQRGLPNDKPPWDFQVIYPEKNKRETIAIIRIHKSLADGTSLMQILCHCFSDTPVVELPERIQYGCLSLAINTIRTLLTGPWTFLIWMCTTSTVRNLLGKKKEHNTLSVIWARVSLNKILRIKQVTRSTLNCVLLSALAGSLRTFLINCGIRRPPDIKVLIPIDIESRTQLTLGNKASSVIITLPVSVEGCVPRLWATKRILDTLKTSSDSVLFYIATAVLMTLTPSSVACHLLNLIRDKAILQFASLPGPATEVFVKGSRLKAIYNFHPPPAQLGISMTVITYSDEIYVSMTADPALEGASQHLLLNFETQIDSLWKLLLHRRVPGEARYMQSISASSMSDIELRLGYVQEEINRLNENHDGDEKTLNLLRNEFSELISELKRRSKVDTMDLAKPRQRTLSCSLTKKPSILSLKSLSTSTSINLFKSDNIQQSTPVIGLNGRKNSYDMIRREKSKTNYMSLPGVACSSNANQFCTKGPTEYESLKLNSSRVHVVNEKLHLLSNCSRKKRPIDSMENKFEEGILI